jgi:hypothetical protein
MDKLLVFLQHGCLQCKHFAEAVGEGESIITPKNEFTGFNTEGNYGRIKRFSGTRSDSPNPWTLNA